MGNGQYGDTYKVECNGKWFAGKKIHERILSIKPNSDKMDTLLKETSQLLQSIKHPNIERYEVALEQTSTFVLLSELLPENLDKFIIRLKEKMSVYLQINICDDMAQGLQYLHSAGIVHKNLHSNNVLITHELRAKIADYICPQVLSLDQVSIDLFKAYLAIYQAPEIKNNTVHTYSSDVFSLGALLFQTVTTNLPITNIDTFQERILINKDINKAPSHHPLHMVIQHCLHSNELARPSVNEVCNKVAEAKETPQYILLVGAYRIKVSIYIRMYVHMYVYNIYTIYCMYVYIHHCVKSKLNFARVKIKVNLITVTCTYTRKSHNLYLLISNCIAQDSGWKKLC